MNQSLVVIAMYLFVFICLSTFFLLPNATNNIFRSYTQDPLNIHRFFDETQQTFVYHPYPLPYQPLRVKQDIDRYHFLGITLNIPITKPLTHIQRHLKRSLSQLRGYSLNSRQIIQQFSLKLQQKSRIILQTLHKKVISSLQSFTLFFHKHFPKKIPFFSRMKSEEISQPTLLQQEIKETEEKSHQKLLEPKENTEEFTIEQQNRINYEYEMVYSHQPDINDLLITLFPSDSMFSSPSHLLKDMISQYLIAIDWEKEYNNKPIYQAVIDSLFWKHHYQQKLPSLDSFAPIIQHGIIYLSSQSNKQQFPLIYFKISRNNNHNYSFDNYLHALIHITNKAIDKSQEIGSNKYITIIDLAHFQWNKCPPMHFLKEAMNIYKLHYPNRLFRVYLLNVSPAFSFFWKLLTPMIPKKVLQRIIVLGNVQNHEIQVMLDDEIGLLALEEEYGGQHIEKLPHAL